MWTWIIHSVKAHETLYPQCYKWLPSSLYAHADFTLQYLAGEGSGFMFILCFNKCINFPSATNYALEYKLQCHCWMVNIFDTTGENKKHCWITNVLTLCRFLIDFEVTKHDIRRLQWDWDPVCTSRDQTQTLCRMHQLRSQHCWRSGKVETLQKCVGAALSLNDASSSVSLHTAVLWAN